MIKRIIQMKLHFKMEHFKSIILTLLIITSVLQVGILWDNEGHGFPFNFIYSFLSTSNDIHYSEEKIIDSTNKSFFKPTRIIVSDGFDSRWMFSDDTDTHYDKLWISAKEYLKEVLIEESKEKRDAKDWVEICEDNPGYIFEFKSVMPMSFVSWLLSMGENSTSSLQSIYKFLISPLEDVNGRISLYLNDGESIYIFKLKKVNANLNNENFLALIENLNKDTEREMIREYSTAFKLFPNQPIRGDLLLSVKGPIYEELPSIIIDVPIAFESQDSDTLKNVILQSEKYIYDQSINRENNAIYFRNTNNSYTITSDGVLEYKHLAKTSENDKGKVSTAFMNAFEFIRLKKELLESPSSIYLSSVQATKRDRYLFTFDYKIGGYPVTFTNNDKLTNAIVIEANSKRVLSSKWIFRNITKTGKHQYDFLFTSLLESAANPYPEFEDVLTNDLFTISNINVNYIVDRDGDLEVKPSWVIDTISRDNESKKFIVELQERKE